ncbi:hypothetical protein AOR13_446 [Alteromonas stellipolaris LMG 21856]|nr:hypothetical protein AOR13_446 [Alteromonas stellipolaris LMG 21856]
MISLSRLKTNSKLISIMFIPYRRNAELWGNGQAVKRPIYLFCL